LSRRRATVRRALGRLLGLFLLRVVGQSFIRPRVFVVVHAREKARVDTARAAP
jgi:hypothetical protein